MNNSSSDSLEKKAQASKKGSDFVPEVKEEKGPLSFLSGALTSGLMAWICLVLSKKTIVYFTLHEPNYNSPIAQSIASGFKTLVVGMCFLATFTFTFIGIGLTLVFIRSLFSGNNGESD